MHELHLLQSARESLGRETPVRGQAKGKKRRTSALQALIPHPFDVRLPAELAYDTVVDGLLGYGGLDVLLGQKGRTIRDWRGPPSGRCARTSSLACGGGCRVRKSSKHGYLSSVSIVEAYAYVSAKAKVGKVCVIHHVVLHRGVREGQR